MNDTNTKSFKRTISKIPRVERFIPADLPMTELETASLRIEEVEAMRLVDFEGLEQEEAANKMGVSRRTLWKDLKSGRKTVIDALVNGKIIKMHGGNYELVGE
ncbi:MAG: hypothetical protein CVT90_01930 [Candidatus Altiarchaeales archaeon HGW-Altiarchaeales-3]|nr:MAG: hypothetical protein CVT90_01930 [Candidatus Altiarchaeales archaeon HGW-Altiarchaeales-3]